MDFLHTVEHFEEACVELTRAADRSEHRAQRARRAMDIEAHFHELRDDLLDLLVGGPFLHDYDHDPSLYIVGSPAGLRYVSCPSAMRSRCRASSMIRSNNRRIAG